MALDGTVDPTPDGFRRDGEIATDIGPRGDVADPTLASLPRESAALSDALLGASNPDLLADPGGSAALMSQLYYLGWLHIVPGDVDAVAWHMLAERGDVSSLGTTTDRLGRPVIAVAAPLYDPELGISGVTILLVEQETGGILGFEEMMFQSSVYEVSEPTVVTFSTVESRAYVAEIGDLPADETPAGGAQ